MRPFKFSSGEQMYIIRYKDLCLLHNKGTKQHQPRINRVQRPKAARPDFKINFRPATLFGWPSKAGRQSTQGLGLHKIAPLSLT